jgi:hypothetical protein
MNRGRDYLSKPDERAAHLIAKMGDPVRVSKEE